ncbi:MAG: GntR family transcriptional regulator [Clostridium sp.]|uniref:GntR family transcriptional regulator n=1 Tax=Clostridium sp. TaxID=1506 RepID=UPI002FC60729
MIDKSSPIPVYFQLKEAILNKISEGYWKVGECIDSERELAEHYEVSRMTIRQALGELVQDGVLVREKGKGTFVCEPKVKQQDVMSFTDIIEKLGGKLQTEVLEFKLIDTPKEFKDILKDDKVYRINRMRKVDGECIAIELVHISPKICGNLEALDLTGSLFKIIEEKGHFINHSESSIKAIVMDDGYKKLFNVDKILPLMSTFGTTLDENDNVLFVEESIYRSDKYVLQVNISRREGKLK